MTPAAGGVVDDFDRGLVEAYLDRIAARDIAGARALVLAELTSGASIADVIGELLVPAMAEVGARWYDGRWSAAQEHVASGITETVLSTASVRSRRGRPAVDAPTAVLACPRGEAHTLPARLAGELLAVAGVDVIVLGLPVPEDDLAGYLAEARPTGLVVSCTEPLALPGLRATVAAAHGVGVPVLVGGAGLGRDGRRGLTVGADGWAGRVDQAVVVLREWRRRKPSLTTAVEMDREVAALMHLGDAFVADATRSLVERLEVGEVVDLEEAAARLTEMLRALACALLGQDDTLLVEHVSWGRGRSATVTDAGLAAIRELLGPGFHGARRLLDKALGATA